MNTLTESLIDALSRIQKRYLIPAPAGSANDLFTKFASGCRSTCSGSCDGTCAGDCENDCPGGCDSGCYGTCEYDCTASCESSEF